MINRKNKKNATYIGCPFVNVVGFADTGSEDEQGREDDFSADFVFLQGQDNFGMKRN
jgi:hypothetical protein